MIKLKNILSEGSSDGGKLAKTHVVYAMNVKLNDKGPLGDNEVETGFRVSVKKGPDAESRAKKLAQKHFGKKFNSIIGIGKALNPEKNNISEASLKGVEGVPSNKKLSQLSDNDKLKIVQSSGNLISFKVPDWSKGKRNFWTVISNGKIVKKKNLNGETIFILPGKGPEKVSPSYSSVKDLLNGVDWDTMELRRESVNEAKVKTPDYIVTSIPADAIPSTNISKADVGLGLSMFDALGRGWTLNNKDYKLDYHNGKVALKLTSSGKTAVRVKSGHDPKYVQKIEKFANDYLSKYAKDIKK